MNAPLNIWVSQAMELVNSVIKITLVSFSPELTFAVKKGDIS